MTDSEQLSRFGQELKILITRFCETHEVTYAAMVGALFITAIDLSNELIERERDRSDDD
jgi:hypothetical protein